MTQIKIKRSIDKDLDIIAGEFSTIKLRRFKDKLVITKSYTMGGTELNYEQTRDDGEFGMPIFTIKDFYANTNPTASA